LQSSAQSFILPCFNPNDPEWVDGVRVNLGKRVIVVTEAANSTTCSSRIPGDMTIKEMLHDYVDLRAFAEGEKEVAIVYEMYKNGKLAAKPTRAVVVRNRSRVSLREVISDIDWLRIARAGKNELRATGSA